MGSARASKKPEKRSRVRAVPWAALLQGGLVVGARVNRLSARERTNLGRLLRESRGWPGRLGPKERAELRKLLVKIDLMGMGRELTPLVRRAGRKRGRR
jgi:hypothetical protein